jgi:hypothetical protein
MIRRDQIGTVTDIDGRVIFTALPAFQHVIATPTDCGIEGSDDATQAVDALFAQCRRPAKYEKAMRAIEKARRLAAEFGIPLEG